MRPAHPSGTLTFEVQAARTSDASPMSSHTRERLPTDLLRLRVQTFECQLERERERSLTTGPSMPPEWSASLERERLILLDQISQNESGLSRSSSLPNVYTSASSAPSDPIPIHSPSPRLPHSAPGSISVHVIPGQETTLGSDTRIYAPTPRFPQSAPASASTYEGVDRQRTSTPYSIRGKASRTRAATTRPLPVIPSSPSPHRRTGSVVNSAPNSLPPISKEADNRGQLCIIRYAQTESSSSPLSKPVRSSTTPSRPPSRPHTRPFLLPPIKIADAQATFANGVGEHSESPERRHFGDDLPFLPSRPASPSPITDAERATSPVHDWLDRPGTPTPLSPPNLVADESGRRSARGWYSTTPRPEARDSLHRFVTRPRPTRAQTERKYEVDDEKGWRVFTEDEDDNAPTHTIIRINTTPTVADTSRFDTRSPTPVPPRPPAAPLTHGHSTVRQGDPTFLQPEAYVPMPLLDTASPALDDYVVSSASAYRPSAAGIRSAGSIGVVHRISKLCTYLVGVFRDLTSYKMFLSYRDEYAQQWLDFLQALLDSSLLDEQLRLILRVALLRLSRKSELYPQCFSLADVTREGEYPVSDGHFGEIYKGCFRGRVVCLKAVKMYETSDQARLYKAFSREAVLWGQLSHTNVLPFYGTYRLGDKRNRLVLVSPWMQNGNINEFLGKNPESDRRLLILDIAAGMLYLHKNGVVHGDLKGANILVTDSMRACLADFGLSSVTDAHGLKNRDLSSNCAEGGTIRFQAPELIDPNLEHPRSEASDVYAFALVCYEIFTGDHPFPEVKNDYTVMVKVGKGERPSRPPGQVYLDRGLTDVMWRLIEDCWKHAPKNRPSAYEIAGRIPRGARGDRRDHGGWGDLSPSRFRASDGYNRDREDGSVVETLSVLETTGSSLLRFTL